MPGERRARESGGRVDAPLEDAQRDVDRLQDHAVLEAQIVGARIDERGALMHRSRRFGRRQPGQAGLGRAEDLVDVATTHAPIVHHK